MPSLKQTSFNLVLMQIFSCGIVALGPLLESLFELRKVDEVKSLRIIFGVIALVGVLYFFSALFNLGKSLTPNPIPKKSSELVTTGLYSLSRHPIYTALIVSAFGWTGFWFSWISALGLIALTIILRRKASFEENLLLQRYGHAYEAYTQTVNRFIPWK